MALKRVTDTQSVMYAFCISAYDGMGVCRAASGGNLGEATSIAYLCCSGTYFNEDLEN